MLIYCTFIAGTRTHTITSTHISTCHTQVNKKKNFKYFFFLLFFHILFWSRASEKKIQLITKWKQTTRKTTTTTVASTEQIPRAIVFANWRLQNTKTVERMEKNERQKEQQKTRWQWPMVFELANIFGNNVTAVKCFCFTLCRGILHDKWVY